MSEKTESEKNKFTKKIMFVGVSGQGISLASDVVIAVCNAAGYEVRVDDVNGSAHKSNSVCRYFQYGEKVKAGKLKKHSADVMLSFDLLESMRWLDYLAEEGLAIVNSQRVEAPGTANAKAKLPSMVIDVLKVKAGKLEMVEGLTLGKKLGNLRMLNIILLGALSRHLEFDEELWRDAITNRVPPRTAEINLKAFELGRNVNSK